jgi:hypothetical protein
MTMYPTMTKTTTINNYKQQQQQKRHVTKKRASLMRFVQILFDEK